MDGGVNTVGSIFNLTKLITTFDYLTFDINLTENNIFNDNLDDEFDNDYELNNEFNYYEF